MNVDSLTPEARALYERVMRVLAEHDRRALTAHGRGYSDGGINFESITLRGAMEDIRDGVDYPSPPT